MEIFRVPLEVEQFENLEKLSQSIQSYLQENQYTFTITSEVTSQGESRIRYNVLNEPTCFDINPNRDINNKDLPKGGYIFFTENKELDGFILFFIVKPNGLIWDYLEEVLPKPEKF